MAPVVPCVTVRPPESEVNATVAPWTKLLLASSTSAVIVAVWSPFEGICGWLVVNSKVCFVSATVTTVVALPLPEVAVTVIAVPAAAAPAVKVAVT